MNAVEIEEAVTQLAEAPFDAATFPYAFLQAFGNNDAAIRKLKSGDTNKSDVLGGVLQRNRNNIHLLACPPGEVAVAMGALRTSPATAKHKARFILATDGQTIQAERFDDGEPLACDYKDLPNRFAYFLSLAGIFTVKRIDENAFDIRATGRLNKLYVELLRNNPDWDTDARRQDLNHFFARLIFCFFAEDTNIFPDTRLFTDTVDRMTERNGSNVHEVLSEIFRAMDVRREDRAESDLRPYALRFPYVNGNLFGGSTETPKFSQAARNYLLFVGNLDWKRINPDIFGSMIQAVADDEERGALGMHYTSVPNILKVLNPLFFDNLRAKLAEAGDSPLKLLNLRKRLARIRVFDPACGSGNFLVIAYKEMRAIEAEINQRRGETNLKSAIPISNFRGIELRHFPTEIARLALIIAEFQCDVLYRGELFACQDFLPLDAANWITCGNALRLNWLQICPPTGTGVKVSGDDLFNTPLDQAEIDFVNEGGDTYICGNPQFKGARKQTSSQKADMSSLFGGHKDFQDCDYVIGWYLKAAELAKRCDSQFAFVSTSSISEGEQVAHLWSRLYADDFHIFFAHRGFKWRNNASNNAVVQCVIIGVRHGAPTRCALYDGDVKRDVDCISPYLISGPELFVCTRAEPLSAQLNTMVSGSMARDGGNLILSYDEAANLLSTNSSAAALIRGLSGSMELIHVRNRKCLWIEDDDLELAESIQEIRERIHRVKSFRLASSAKTTKGYAAIPHKFAQRSHKNTMAMIVSATSSEERAYIPADIFDENVVITNLAFGVYNPALWELSLVVSTLHKKWVETVCGKLETRLRYSSTLGWNTFPVPTLTDAQKADLARCAGDILLAREAHFPATIAEMYDPEAMNTEYPDLRAAHDRNDETLERIYIGRRFRNDTERLEKLFELYTAMTAGQAKRTPANRKKKGA